MNVMDKDFTQTGMKIVGAFENDRNRISKELIKKIICEVFHPVDDAVIVGHHITFEVTYTDGKFEYQQVQEIPSMDEMIFDVEIAKKLWGPRYKEALCDLACEPISSRDTLLSRMYENRVNGEYQGSDKMPVIAQGLRDAEAAHHAYETMLGHRDENWPEWYAQYLLSHQDII